MYKLFLLGKAEAITAVNSKDGCFSCENAVMCLSALTPCLGYQTHRNVFSVHDATLFLFLFFSFFKKIFDRVCRIWSKP